MKRFPRADAYNRKIEYLPTPYISQKFVCKVMELILNLNRCNFVCIAETATQQLISPHLIHHYILRS